MCVHDYVALRIRNDDWQWVKHWSAYSTNILNLVDRLQEAMPFQTKTGGWIEDKQFDTESFTVIVEHL